VTLLTKASWWCGGIFLVLSLVLSLVPRGGNTSGLQERLRSAGTPTAPSAPLPLGGTPTPPAGTAPAAGTTAPGTGTAPGAAPAPTTGTSPAAPSSGAPAPTQPKK
jgi:preprotein translocase subunit SecG